MSLSIDLDTAEKILEEVLKMGVQEAIVRLQSRVYERIDYDSGNLRSYSVSRTIGVGIRVVVDGGAGYSYTTWLDMESIRNCIREAISVAKAMALHGIKKRFTVPKPVKDIYRVEVAKDPLSIDPESKIKIIEELNRYSMKKQGIVSAITRLGIERDRRIVVSSIGTRVEVDVTSVGISHLAVAKVGVVAERVADSKTFIGGYEHIEKEDWFKFIDEIDDLAIRASQAKTPSPGTYIAVIDNELIGLLLHEAFGHASEGDGVLAQASVLRGKIGEKVASDLVTIVDEGLIKGGYPVPYDDEGVPKTQTIVVEDGILKHYLHSRETAIELNQSLTGNARAQDITFDTIVRQTNYYLKPRDWKVDELFEGISYGIYLRGRGAMGGQVDASVGTFTFSVGPSYIIKNGEPTELVRGVIVSGNILETLKEIDAVANDLEIRTSVFGGCGKANQIVRVGHGGPHVRVKKIVVGGK